MVESFYSVKYTLCKMSRYLRTYIDNCNKEKEIRAAYSEKSTPHFDNVANITIDSDDITPQKKKMGERKIIRNIVRNIIRYLPSKKKQIIVQFQSKQLNQTRAIKLNKSRAKVL